MFCTNVDKDTLWEKYLSSFNEEDNKLFRKRTKHDCSTCKHFIRGIGNVVAIDEAYNLHTVWDIDMTGTIYEPVVKAMSDYVKSRPVAEEFLTTFKKFGNEYNFEEVEASKPIKWEHLWVDIDRKFLYRDGKEMNRVLANTNGTITAFKNALTSIKVEDVDTVLDMINDIYRGVEYKQALIAFKQLLVRYNAITDNTTKNNFCYLEGSRQPSSATKIKNTAIGTLLEDIASGMDLEQAVTRYEKVVAPENYKRSKPIYTQKMLDDAKKTIAELGYMDSLQRRFATLDDITINNVLFANRDIKKKLAPSEVNDIFNEMSKSAKNSKSNKRPENIQKITEKEFVEKVLPIAQELEIWFENRHEKQMVSMTAPVNKESQSMFKWSNPIGWAYTGNITDSALKANVKNAGGKVDGDLRFSIQWNDVCVDKSDLDAHCITPNGFEIMFSSKYDRNTHGELDIDIINPTSKPAVENITWATRRTMQDGEYLFYVHNYTDRGSRLGFRAEIEFDGNIYRYDYRLPLKNKESVKVAVVTLKDGVFSIKHLLPEQEMSRDIWGLKSNEFQQVQLVCYSPNYFDEQNGFGNQHLFFMLKDCISPEEPNGFYNEYLKPELYEHRKVFEALGSRFHVQSVPDQLSGVGFSLTQRADVVVRVNSDKLYDVIF